MEEKGTSICRMEREGGTEEEIEKGEAENDAWGRDRDRREEIESEVVRDK